MVGGFIPTVLATVLADSGYYFSGGSVAHRPATQKPAWAVCGSGSRDDNRRTAGHQTPAPGGNFFWQDGGAPHPPGDTPRPTPRPPPARPRGWCCTPTP